MHDILLILAAVLVTMATRFLPVLIFGKDIFLIPSMVLIAVLLTTTRKTGQRKEEKANA